jgi:hypothetical protein
VGSARKSSSTSKSLKATGTPVAFSAFSAAVGNGADSPGQGAQSVTPGAGQLLQRETGSTEDRPQGLTL